MRHRYHLLPLCLMSAALLFPSESRAAAPAEPIVYTLRFPAPHTHYVDVEAVVPAAGRPSVELMMAVWTPGSYLVREYSRHVEALLAHAPDGTALAVAKTRKNRWRVAAGGAPRVVVTYRVYCRDLGVRTNFVDDGMAVLNGAPTFLTLAGDRGPRPHEVRLELPAGWRTSVTGLDAAPDRRPHHYLAPDFDTLVDSPIVAGNQAVYEFEVAGRTHVLVNEGEAGVWDGARSARDVEKIVRAADRLWGGLPYDRYVFLNVLGGSGGGLEHANSTLMMAGRWGTRTERDYRRWVGLVSHEYFHAWNVKRLRPVELGPFDYEDEVYTTGLWIAEGFTDYYGDLQLRRAGLGSRDDYLSDLSGQIQQLQTTPGRLVQPVAQASFDAWIRQYRPDENSPNVAISYYTKGSVVAFLLDARIRRATDGARSLDDVMRIAYQRYGGPRGFTQEEFRRLASEVAGTDLAAWFARAVDSTEELDYTEALEWFGLRFKPAQPRQDKGWLGAETRTDGGRVMVTRVTRATPAFDAGLNVDDEILAIDDLRLRPGALDGRLERYRPGDKVVVLVARREQVRRIEVTLGAEPADAWKLEAHPDATPAQQARVEAWLWEK